MARTTLCSPVNLLGSATVTSSWAADLVGTVKSIDRDRKRVIVTQDGTGKDVAVTSGDHTVIKTADQRVAALADLRPGSHVVIHEDVASEIVIEQQSTGRVKSIDPEDRTLIITDEETGRDVAIHDGENATIERGTGGDRSTDLSELVPGQAVAVLHADGVAPKITVYPQSSTILHDFWENFRHNLFKPLLLFFYAGFLIPILRVKFEFPYVIYQGLTLYLLIAIGWHGGEELAMLPGSSLGQAVGFMVVGSLTDSLIGIPVYIEIAKLALRTLPA